MLKWLRRTLGQAAEPAPQVDDLALKREAQSLRLEMEERERLVASLKSELERQRNGESALSFAKTS